MSDECQGDHQFCYLLSQVDLAHQQPRELISWLLEVCAACQNCDNDVQSQNIDEHLQHFVESIAQASQSAGATLMLLDSSNGSLLTKVRLGPPSQGLAETRINLGEGIAGWVAQHQQPLLLPAGPGIPDSLKEAVAREAGASALYLPLKAEGQLLGVIHLRRLAGAPPFDLQELWLLSLIANRLAKDLRDERLYNQIAHRERFITLILESIPISWIIIDNNLRVVSVNRNFIEKSKREERTTLGRKIVEVFPQVLVEYIRIDQKAREVFRTGHSVEGGKVAYRAPGLPARIYYYRLIPLKVDLVVENVMLLMEDITEREQLEAEVKRAERHLASVVNCANDVVISTDLEGHIVSWNRAAEQVSGFKAETINGRRLLSLCTAEQSHVMADMLDQLGRGESVQNSEVNLLTSDDKGVPIAWSCSPLRDDLGKVVGIVAVGRDLTERRRLEAQLLQSAKMASLGVMAGGIAHELRNPLGIISATTQLLFERPGDASFQSTCLEKILAATQRASLIIENLLKFSRPGGGQMQKVNVLDILKEAISLLKHQLSLQKVVLETHYCPDQPEISGNPDLLQQVFINLIHNACNAMNQGGTLSISTELTSSKEVKIQFSDTGCGIPKEHLAKIFDPFFTTMPIGKGTGLGLSISYSIIQHHKGNIMVESQEGKGSTFAVCLPAAG